MEISGLDIAKLIGKVFLQKSAVNLLVGEGKGREGERGVSSTPSSAVPATALPGLAPHSHIPAVLFVVLPRTPAVWMSFFSCLMFPESNM